MLQYLSMTDFTKYIFLAKLGISDSWQYLGEAEADSPEAAIIGIARNELQSHNPQTTIEDVITNYRRFGRWRVIPVASDDEGNPEIYTLGDLDLEY